jgi:ADP-ribose pyrophosphatase
MGHDPADSVEVVETERRLGYDGFFKISVRRLGVRRFDGTMAPEVVREVFERGNAAAVLPYDPRLDKVLLIRQFLPGAYAGNHAPRPLQVVAGMVDKSGEAYEDVARREAEEEAGVTIGRVVPAQAFQPSPGGSSERIETFLAEADLSGAGGIHGLAEEQEDILSVVVPADEAIALLDAGAIEAGPAVVLLLWFARHRDRIRAEWTARA